MDYYQKKYPEYESSPLARAVRVTFTVGEQPVYVAAELLRPRVNNDNFAKFSEADR